MNYTDSITDFFKSPHWAMNMVFGGLCVLIPIIGPIVLLGWLVTGFWGRQDQSFETFPAFDFSHFGKYLERGFWPFLVSLVAGMAVALVVMPFFCMLLFTGILSANRDGVFAGYFAVLINLVLVFVVMAASFVIVPLKIRASMAQDFATSFDFRFVRRFISLTWLEMVLSSLFIVVLSPILICLGAIVFCVGIYFATVLIYFSWTHLFKQLYALYLSRGGEPVPVSPKLSDPLSAESGV